MTTRRRLAALLAAALAGAALPAPALAVSLETPAEAPFAAAVERARRLSSLETLLVAQNGVRVVDEGFRGKRTTAPTNIKSASKSVVSALVGIAIDRGILEGVDQKVAPILADKLPADPDPRMAELTIGHLLSMQAGLERTSGPYYGAWTASRDWVRAALARPFVEAPGGSMLYSTGSTHLLSAILTRASGRSTRALAVEWLEKPAGVAVASWERDPQGIYFGGNQMAMTPRSLLAFGELYRNEGRSPDGTQVIPARWIEQSWVPRTKSRFSGEDYGYGWFSLTMNGHPVRYGWGYGGQMIYVVPDLELTVAITSAQDAPSARTGYKDDLHRLVAETILPAAEARIAAARVTAP